MKEWNETESRVINYEITVAYKQEHRYTFLSINLEYSVDNRTINTWTDEKNFGTRANCKRYYRELDKEATMII